MSFWSKIFKFKAKNEPVNFFEASSVFTTSGSKTVVIPKSDVQVVQEAMHHVRNTNDLMNTSGLPEPKNYTWSERSHTRLKTCHPDIQKVMNEAIKYIDFSVLEGTRSKATQDEYFAKGTSKVKYPNSYHNTLVEHIKPEHRPTGLPLTVPCSLAIDIVPYPLDWEDMKAFAELARIIKICARRYGVPLDWGFDLWAWDTPHWQLTTYRIGK